MENLKENVGNNEIPKHPKPSDQIQEQIETVTPATENVKPTSVSTPANNGNEQATVDNQITSNASIEKQSDKNKSRAALDTNNKNMLGGNNNSPDDAIETVSP